MRSFRLITGAGAGAGASRMRTLAGIAVAMAWAAASPAATVTARATSESFSIGEPIIIEMTFTGISALLNYGMEVDPAGKDPPMGLFNTVEAGFIFPVARTSPDRALRHEVLVNKWVTLDAPGKYSVTIDGVVAIAPGASSGHRFVKSVVVNVVERNEQRVQDACEQWSERANAPVTLSLEDRVDVAQPVPPQRFAQQVLMYLQEEALIPCLLKSASRRNLAPAITLREIESVASVHALRDLIDSPIPEVSRESRYRLTQLMERTKKPEVRAAAAEVLGLSPPG